MMLLSAQPQPPATLSILRLLLQGSQLRIYYICSFGPGFKEGLIEMLYISTILELGTCEGRTAGGQQYDPQ